MLRAIKKLYRINVLSPAGLYRLLGSFFRSGINLMALLRFSARMYPRTVAVVDERESISYLELYSLSLNLSAGLRSQYGIAEKKKVAVVCRNSAALVKSLFALSYIGADIFLVNADMGKDQFAQLIRDHSFDLVIYDAEFAHLVAGNVLTIPTLLSYHHHERSVDSLARQEWIRQGKERVHGRPGKIVVLSGGTTGKHKLVERKPAVGHFIKPLSALLVGADLDLCKSVYIATPVYHGFGLASLFMSVLLGSKIFLQRRFDAAKACDLVRVNKIDVVTLVPIMLHRMMAHDAASLGGVARIISGGAPLSPDLIRKTHTEIGLKLFNLYGTSEAGFCIMASPVDLSHSANTIGKPITGVEAIILGDDNNEVAKGCVGRICIKTEWSASGSGQNWIETGDLGYRDDLNRFFLCGRIDDMIVSGGENVYPAVLENILADHAAVREVAVIGVENVEYGQRLKAFVVPDERSKCNVEDLFVWLKNRVARYQVPVAIEVVDSIPYTPLGKPDKRALAGLIVTVK